LAKIIKAPNIKDVAKEANVSVSTVSSVINNSRFVKKEKMDRVGNAIKKLNYKVNPIARGLRTRKVNAVGVILPDIADPYFAQVIKGMEKVAKERNYTLVLGCSFYNILEEERQIELFLSHYIDGIIFFCGLDSYSHIKKVFNAGVSVVVVDREIKDKKIPSVLIDNTLAMEQAIDYLCNFGHRNIGYLTFSFENQTTIRKRYEGYIRAHKKHNLTVKNDLVLVSDSIKLNELEGTYNLVKNSFNKKNIPTAFATVSDLVAVSLISVLTEMGYEIPKDISIIGFNNENICKFSIPSLTSVKQPKKEMGEQAMQLLLDAIEGKKNINKNLILSTQIIERNSVAKPRKY